MTVSAARAVPSDRRGAARGAEGFAEDGNTKKEKAKMSEQKKESAICVPVDAETFERLEARAAANGRAVRREAANIIRRAVVAKR